MALEIVKASRCIFPGGKAVLMGYDANGKEVFGIGIKTKTVVRWCRAGVSRGDLKRLQREYAAWQKENNEKT